MISAVGRSGNMWPRLARGGVSRNPSLVGGWGDRGGGRKMRLL
jgi:hypothetical protein